MAAKRPLRRLLVLSLASALLLGWRRGHVALVKDGEAAAKGRLAGLRGEVAGVGRFWEQPHNVRLSHKGLGVSSISQGKDQWQLSVSEDGDPDKPGAFVSQETGRQAAFGLEYDSTKSAYSVADAAGLKLKRVAFAAASKGADEGSVDWTLHVEGDKGRQFSAVGDNKSVAYDGSFGVEVPVIDGVALRYALDAKRRAGAKGALPSWVRHSAGVKYDSPVGKVTMHMHQPNPDVEEAPIEYEAQLEGDIRDPRVKGSPSYALSVSKEGSTPLSYDAKVKVKGPEGLTGGLNMGVRGGEPAVSAFGEYSATRAVADGVTVGGDTKVVLTPPGPRGQVLELHPVGLRASADLGKLAPSLADAGSAVDLRVRYKLGAERPAVTASAKLAAKRLAALELAAEASVDDGGRASGKVKVSGTARGVAAQYEATAAPGRQARHAAQVVSPAAQLPRGGSARAFGRLRQSGADNGGKPRLQLGVQYDFGTDVAGRRVRVQGESAAYDSGSTLLGEDGLAWRDARLNRIRRGAATLRNRIELSGSESHKWLHR